MIRLIILCIEYPGGVIRQKYLSYTVASRCLINVPKVKLLVQLLSFVDQEDCFALRGGTAINLFVCEFPRLSVDIDLT